MKIESNLLSEDFISSTCKIQNVLWIKNLVNFLQEGKDGISANKIHKSIKFSFEKHDIYKIENPLISRLCESQTYNQKVWIKKLIDVFLRLFNDYTKSKLIDDSSVQNYSNISNAEKPKNGLRSFPWIFVNSAAFQNFWIKNQLPHKSIARNRARRFSKIIDSPFYQNIPNDGQMKTFIWSQVGDDFDPFTGENLKLTKKEPFRYIGGKNQSNNGNEDHVMTILALDPSKITQRDSISILPMQTNQYILNFIYYKGHYITTDLNKNLIIKNKHSQIVFQMEHIGMPGKNRNMMLFKDMVLFRSGNVDENWLSLITMTFNDDGMIERGSVKFLRIESIKNFVQFVVSKDYIIAMAKTGALQLGYYNMESGEIVWAWSTIALDSKSKTRKNFTTVGMDNKYVIIHGYGMAVGKSGKDTVSTYYVFKILGTKKLLRLCCRHFNSKLITFEHIVEQITLVKTRSFTAVLSLNGYYYLSIFYLSKTALILGSKKKISDSTAYFNGMVVLDRYCKEIIIFGDCGFFKQLQLKI